MVLFEYFNTEPSVYLKALLLTVQLLLEVNIDISGWCMCLPAFFYNSWDKIITPINFAII